MPYPLSQEEADRWQYKAFPNFNGGLNLRDRPDSIEDTECIQLHNVKAKQGSIRSDTGYIPFAQVVVGTPQAQAIFQRQAGDIDIMLVTTKTLYTYSFPFARWHLVKGSAGTTAAASTLPGASSVTVASAAGFSTGDLVGFSTSDGDQHQTTINISGTTFNLVTPLPADKSVASGAAVVRALVLNGSLENQVSYTVVASHDWFVFTNNIDIVKRYDGTDCVDVPNLPSTGNTVCRAVAVYNAALFLFNTVEGGTEYPYRVRRSDQADPTNWTTGTAGKDDLADRASPIVCGVVLGPYLIVYREDAIVRGQFVGAGGINYVFDEMVSGDGALATNAVCAWDNFHIVAGTANVYLYRGDFALEAIGDKIFYKTFGDDGDMIPNARNKTFCVPVTELDEVWIFYASKSEYPDKVLRLNVKDGIWYTREFAEPFVGWGYFQAQDEFTWDTLEGSWDEQPWAWNSQMTQELALNINLCAANTSQVMQYDYDATLDNGQAIEYIVETKDIRALDAKLRFDMLEAFIAGNSIRVEYSTDEGDNWHLLGEVNEEKTTRIRLFSQFICNTLRFRFKGSSPNFVLDMAGCSYKVESLF